jgi:hypothetical protein
MTVAPPTAQQRAIIAAAAAQIGKPYEYDGKGPATYDCSGLTAWAFDHGADISIGAGTSGQLLTGTLLAENVPFDQVVSSLQLCDLVFPTADHVQLYVGDGQIIEAPHTGAFVQQVPEWAVPPYQSTVYQVRRYLPTTAPVVPRVPPKWPGRVLLLQTPSMTGEDVTAWQAELVRRDFDLGTTGPARNGVDGDFGPYTSHATAGCQQQLGFTGNQVDSKVGPVTWKAAFAQ